MTTLLKALLQEQHLQTYELFRREFTRAATRIESDCPPPSLSQYRRWLAGEVKNLPQARFCRVLVEMLPGRTATELFGPADQLEQLRAANFGSESSEQEIDAPGGRLTDMHTEVSIDIAANGHAVINYVYDTLNLTDRPVGRVPRTVFFKHTHEHITVEPVEFSDHQVRIETQHETDLQKKFAYRISPAIEPQGRAKFGCEIRGGAFLDDLYWRHLAIRDTELATIDVVHRGHTLDKIIATEEQADGSEILISDDVEWRQDGPDLRLRLQRRALEPTQVVTLRWETQQP